MVGWVGWNFIIIAIRCRAYSCKFWEKWPNAFYRIIELQTTKELREKNVLSF